MTKKELIGIVSEKNVITKAAATDLVESVFETIKEAVATGDKVDIFGFGVFSVAESAARTGRNPRTGETIEIAASKNPKFKAAKAFKDAVRA